MAATWLPHLPGQSSGSIVGQTSSVDRLRLAGASGGAVFALLVVVGYTINLGPSSGDGVSVVAYYSTHATQAQWEAALVGIAAIFFIWFAAVFADQTSSGPLTPMAAAVTAALYLVAVGCWEVLGELYGGVRVVDLTAERLGDARVLYDVGIGAVHMANLAATAFIWGLSLGMLRAPAPWRRVGWIGVGFVAAWLTTALIVLVSQSRWSDVLGTIVFLAFLGWVFLVSVSLVLLVRRGLSMAPRALSEHL